MKLSNCNRNMDVNKNCPECCIEYNNTTHRKVKEACSHSKCRQCFIFADTECHQCEKDSSDSVITTENKNCDTENVKTLDSNALSLPSPCKIKSEWAKLASESIKRTDDNIEAFTYDFVDVSNSEILLNNIENSVLRVSNEKDETKSISEGGEQLKPNNVTNEDYCVNTAPIKSKNIIILENKLLRPAINRVENLKNMKKKKAKNQYSLAKKNYKKFIAPQYLELKKIKNTLTGKFDEHYFCNICNKQLRSTQQKRYHLYCDKTEKKPFPCNECDKEFVTKYHLDYHMESHRTKTTYNCDFCNKEFVRKISLQNHKRGHIAADYKFKCDKCYKKFRSKPQLKEHKLMHENCLPHKCIKCDKCFFTKSNLNNHMISHSVEKKFVCNTCGMKFPRKNALKTHELIHKPKRYHECSKCMRRFVDQKNLDRHSKTHLDYKEFECPLCPIKSSRRDNFLRHIKNIHPNYNLNDLKTSLSEKIAKQKTSKKIFETESLNIDNLQAVDKDLSDDISDKVDELNTSSENVSTEVLEKDKLLDYLHLPKNEPKYVGVIKSVGNAKPVRLLYKHNKSINLFKSIPENIQKEVVIYEKEEHTNIINYISAMENKQEDAIKDNIVKEVKKVEHQVLDQNIAAQIELNLQNNNNKGFNKFRNEFDDNDMNCRKRSHSNIEIYKRILTPYTNSNDNNNIKRTYSNDFSNKINNESNNKQNNIKNEKVTKKYDPIEIYRKILLPSQDDESSTNYDINDNDKTVNNDDNNLDNNKHLNINHENNFSEMHWRKRTSQCFLLK